MTRDEITRMAREAGIERVTVGPHDAVLHRFAALVAAAEREACARLCEAEAQSVDGVICAQAIRARGRVLESSQPRQWQGLTEDEINACDPQEECWNLLEVARAIEAKLREKNT